MRKIIEYSFLVLGIGCIVAIFILYYDGNINYNIKEDKQEIVIAKNNTIEEVLEDKKILDEYNKFYQANSEIIGWINIPNTNVNYPVMQSKEDNEKYLYLGFDEKYSYSGTPFLDNRCSIEPDNKSNNLLIYGHNMKNGSMFANILKYKNEQFYKENPYIFFDSIYEKGKYQIMACFRSPVYNIEDEVFKYYKFFGSSNKEEFENYVKEVKKMALYDTGINANFGDELITLSTCITEDDRFVVVAKKITT